MIRCEIKPVIAIKDNGAVLYRQIATGKNVIDPLVQGPRWINISVATRISNPLAAGKAHCKNILKAFFAIRHGADRRRIRGIIEISAKYVGRPFSCRAVMLDRCQQHFCLPLPLLDHFRKICKMSVCHQQRPAADRQFRRQGVARKISWELGQWDVARSHDRAGADNCQAIMVHDVRMAAHYGNELRLPLPGFRIAVGLLQANDVGAQLLQSRFKRPMPSLERLIDVPQVESQNAEGCHVLTGQRHAASRRRAWPLSARLRRPIVACSEIRLVRMREVCILIME
jgi:hypothetical protein